MFKQPLLFLIFATIFICCTQNQSAESKEVMFICPHGAARSPIAAAYFNKLVKEKNLNYHAIFRGTEPDATLSSKTVEGLTAEGIDIEGWKPSIVTEKDINTAYKIVTFDCKVPADNVSALQEQWNGTPSPSKAYEDYTATVRKKVEQLVEQLPTN